MRIFFLVFGLLLLVLASGSVYFFGKDYIVERYAAYRFTQDLTELQHANTRGDVVSDCSEGGLVDNRPYGYQLRFISETDYVIESVCLYNTADNKIVKEGSLFGGMRRVYGSGIHMVPVKADQEDAWVQLQYKDKTFYGGLFNNKPEVKTDRPDSDIGGDSPAIANCTDWGFTCCSQVGAVASGMQVPTLDCANTCYQYCQQKPLLLYFNTNPPMNTSARTLYLRGKDQTVTFGYQIQDDSRVVDKVVVDFGDGKQSQTNELQLDDVNHTYTCSSGQCTYTATISVSGSTSIGLSNTTTNQVKIVISR